MVVYCPVMDTPFDPLAPWRNPVALTGVLANDVRSYLAAYGCTFTLDHSAAVADEARGLAGRFGVDMARAEAAGWLHDVSAVIPKTQRAEIALALGLPVLPEEHTAPSIVHQKLSAALAEAVFGVDDAGVLDAVRYHTTLHPGADALAKVVFLADKIRWDQPGEPPYLVALTRALSEGSLETACCAYLSYLMARRSMLSIVHPWMATAYHTLCPVPGGRP
jgi:predicted HD superfamily hydrolase involved in NAD metabolism